MNNSNLKKIRDFLEKNEYYIFIVIMIIVVIAFITAFFLAGDVPDRNSF